MFQKKTTAGKVLFPKVNSNFAKKKKSNFVIFGQEYGGGGEDRNRLKCHFLERT
jgi:hypothetical protein